MEVTLQKKNVMGFVISEVLRRPSFAVKPISRIIDNVLLPKQLVELHRWLQAYYPSPSGMISQLFLPKNLPQKVPSFNSDRPVNTVISNLPKLTREQSRTVKELGDKSGTALLHGDTGTGKTRVYIELAAKVLSKGRSVIVLTPEIGLTPQLEKSFRDAFSDQVLVSHSHLTSAERRDIWLKAAKITPKIVIGPRSALFLPIHNLGLVVMDEAHDSSYKQEQSPHYLATRVAAKLANLHDCLCLLGTATPLVADYFLMQKAGAPILRMSEPISQSIKRPDTLVIDRTDKSNFGRSWLFSDQIISSVESTHKEGRASLIFLNRRGTARLSVCQKCSWHADCPRCDVPLTYHQDEHKLRCHLCGYSSAPYMECPKCGSEDILFQAAGTKALYDEAIRLFPNYRVKRFDSDVSKDESLAKWYTPLLSGEVDILIGTQIIAKGLDLPNLGLVAIPFADTGLYLPDFTTDEQTYHLLTQVMGRVGRTKHQTSIIIQTYNPKQPAIKAAVAKEWDVFYNRQLEERKKFGFPPYKYLLQLSISKKRESTITSYANKLAQQISEKYPAAVVLGPSPRFHRKIRDSYNWQIIVKADTRDVLLNIIKGLPKDWRYNLDPTNLL